MKEYSKILADIQSNQRMRDIVKCVVCGAAISWPRKDAYTCESEICRGVVNSIIDEFYQRYQVK